MTRPRGVTFVNNVSIDRLSNDSLIQHLDSLDARDRRTTAELLVCLGEVHARKLYLAAGYPSMVAWCAAERRYSMDIAFRRMRAARAARRFPSILEAVSDGRLHVTGVSMLAEYLTESNAAELLAAATNRTKAEIELLIAQRFPKTDVPTLIRALNVPEASERSGDADWHQCQSGSPESSLVQGLNGPDAQATPVPAESTAPPPSAPAAPYPRVTPIAPERFAMQVTIGQETRDKLRRAQELLGHQVPSGDLAQVLDRALDALIEKLEARKCGATSQPRAPRPRTNRDSRYVPLDVRRAVWNRDGGQCTFVSDKGKRCEARSPLEFDHVHDFARGGNATISGIRLRCRAHNQYSADLTYGVEFMRQKRSAAQRARAPGAA
jgi:hypothetical protein